MQTKQSNLVAPYCAVLPTPDQLTLYAVFMTSRLFISPSIYSAICSSVKKN